MVDIRDFSSVGGVSIHFLPWSVRVANNKPRERHWWWTDEAWETHCRWLASVFGTHAAPNPNLDVCVDKDGNPGAFKTPLGIIAHPAMRPAIEAAILAGRSARLLDDMNTGSKH